MTAIKSQIQRIDPSADGNRWIQDLNETRRKNIALILERDGLDPVIAAITADMELTETSTNRKMLENIGVSVPPGVPSEDNAVEFIRTVTGGLASLNIFVTNTNGLTDEDLAKKLHSVIDDEVRCIAPNPYLAEFIDLSDNRSSPEIEVDRDRFLPTRIDPVQDDE